MRWPLVSMLIAGRCAFIARPLYPEDDEYLVDRETTVSLFEVAAAQAG